MLDIKALLPEVQKLFPDKSPEEILAKLKELAKAHPDLDNQGALQALSQFLSQDEQGGGQSAPPPQAAPQPPFQGLVNSLPQGVR